MSNNLDYQLIEKKSIDKFENLGLKNIKLLNKEKARFGFYYLAIELITGIHDDTEITKMIIDTDFMTKIYHKKNIDYGVDAVYIDDDKNEILLFNFKYRDKFKKLSTAGTNELIISEKFLSIIGEESEIEYADKTVSYLKEINSRLDDVTEWKIFLYMVSNDGEKLDINSPDLKCFKKNYNNQVKLVIISLNELAKFLSICPKDNYATVILENNDVLTYEENSMTTSKSFIIKLSLVDLIKITNIDTDLRTVLRLENIDQFADLDLDRSVLFDNVRGYLGDTTYNKNIVKTLIEEPEKFFLFNNGITIVADQVESSKQNLDKQLKIDIKNYQIVNGGQTLRSIYKFKEENLNKINNLVSANVLVRIFKTGHNEGLINKIAEYTNSQNAISEIDLKSVDKIQIDLERNLREHGICYLRKNEVDPILFEFEHKISMIKVGQLLFAYHGHPEKVSNQKKKIFSIYYHKLFNYNDKLLELIIELIYKYFEIDQEYNDSGYEIYEQKIFYIIFLDRYIHNIKESINFLETELKNYKKEEDIPPSRKMIQIKFKEEIRKQLESKLKIKEEIKILNLR